MICSDEAFQWIFQTTVTHLDRELSQNINIHDLSFIKVKKKKYNDFIKAERSEKLHTIDTWVL